MLLHLYASYAWPLDAAKPTANGRVANGHVPGQSVDRRIGDAEEFELEGLMSDEEEGTPARRKKENGSVP